MRTRLPRTSLLKAALLALFIKRQWDDLHLPQLATGTNVNRRKKQC